MNLPTKKRRLGALCLLSALMLAGCAADQGGTPAEAILAFDVSCPAKGRMLRYAQLMYRAQRQLPPGSQLRVYLFGHECQLHYAGERIAGRDVFNSKIASALAAPPPRLLVLGTRADLLLEQIAQDVVKSKCSVVLIATDGGMEDQSDQAMRRLNRSVQSLAKSPGLKLLALSGVAPRFRRQWEHWLEPLGSRAVVRGEEDAQDGTSLLLSEGGMR